MRISDWSSDVCSSDLSLGVNWKHVFGPIQAGAQFVYGFSNFDVTRDLTVLDRTITESFKGRQWDGNVELGYDVLAGSGVTVLTFGKLALRHWTLGGFTEQGGAGLGLTAGRDSKTVFVHELRSEERRAGHECVSKCRYRWVAYHSKK